MAVEGFYMKPFSNYITLRIKNKLFETRIIAAKHARISGIIEISIYTPYTNRAHLLCILRQQQQLNIDGPYDETI